jgi:uncharacterized lipoprotein
MATARAGRFRRGAGSGAGAIRRLAAGLFLLLPLAACQTKPGGGTRIPDADWQGFLAEIVTPRFPDGFTVIDSSGQWRNPQTGIVTRQRSEVLDVVAPDTPETLAKLDQIADAWKARTHHLSVGLVLAPVCAAF